MPHSRTAIVAVILFALLAAGCASHVVQRSGGAAGIYQRGYDRFQRGDHYEAIQIFQELLRDYPGSEYVDKAMYYLGRSQLESGEYALAAGEFDQLISDHPESPLVPDAEFYDGECFYRQIRSPQYDPDMTEQSLTRFRRFIRLYPDSPLRSEAEKRIAFCLDWLAHKGVVAAQQYMRLKHPESARVYYQRVIDQFPDSRWAAEARLGIGETYEVQGKLDEARTAYQNAIDDSKEASASVKQEAERRLRALGKGRS